MKLEKRYEWKMLTEDGLLKEPRFAGYPEDYSLSQSYESEEHAVTAYQEFVEIHKHDSDNELVLICVYRQIF